MLNKILSKVCQFGFNLCTHFLGQKVVGEKVVRSEWYVGCKLPGRKVAIKQQHYATKIIVRIG